MDARLRCTLAIVCLAFGRCMENGGIGHEGEAKISGKVLYQTGEKSSEGIAVYCNDADFICDTLCSPQRTPSTFTDASGNFTVPIDHDGDYFIEVNDGRHFAAGLHAHISQDSRSVTLPADTLTPTGEIRGKLVFDDGPAETVTIAVPGLARSALRNNDNDSFFLEDIPRGEYTLSFSSSNPQTAPATVAAITVRSAAITRLCLTYGSSDTTPPHRLKLLLNTTAAGTATTSPIYHFPVLIRLTEDNFDFSSAQNDGTDLRITTADGIYLPFSIERWNCDTRHAELWVTIDTLHADDSTQALILLWGTNSGLRPAGMFDTTDGFQGVWHLSEAGGDTIHDATLHHFDGIPYGMTKGSSVEGLIATCQEFDGKQSYISMPNTADSRLNFPENSYFSISAWIYLDTLASTYQAIASKSNQLYGIGITEDNVTEFFEFETEDSWKTNLGPASAGTWMLVTGISAGERQYLYINDICVDSIPEAIGGKKYRVTTDPFTVGRRTSASVEGWFRGRIDEVRVYSTAVSTDWIRCCYLNQREDNRLVVFENQ